ncbi:MAG: hypothetical protein AB8B96_11285 [Lysobacterales bacterium]
MNIPSLLLSLLIIGLLASLPVGAATVTLKDGSVVNGKVSALRNGVYTVTSQSLGSIKLAEADIESISYGNRRQRSDTQQRHGSDHNQEIQQIQRGLAGDSVTMSMISELQNDPQLKAILEDPDIMRAVSAGDLATLMASEKFMALMNNAGIKDITRKVTGE